MGTTRRQALADADGLALRHAIWTAETTPAREQRYRALLTDTLPPGHRYQPGHREQWLWRTLHAAELAGQDPDNPAARHDWQHRACLPIDGSSDTSTVEHKRVASTQRYAECFKEREAEEG